MYIFTALATFVGTIFSVIVGQSVQFWTLQHKKKETLRQAYTALISAVQSYPESMPQLIFPIGLWGPQLEIAPQNFWFLQIDYLKKQIDQQHETLQNNVDVNNTDIIEKLYKLHEDLWNLKRLNKTYPHASACYIAFKQNYYADICLSAPDEVIEKIKDFESRVSYVFERGNMGESIKVERQNLIACLRKQFK